LPEKIPLKKTRRRQILAPAKMKKLIFLWAAVMAALSAGRAQTNTNPPAVEHHRATHLGHPATRFAPTIYTLDDLRERYRNPKLRPDFIEVLRQWGWPGNPEDLFAAGLTNAVAEWQIPVGNTMPFMSSREDGKPICLRNVTWAGEEPIHAYAFLFHSNGRIWRCVTPKPCSNFFVEDLGPEPQSGLALDCDAPSKVILGRDAKICLNLHNIGNIPTPLATVTLPLPDGATASAVTDGGVITNNSLVWNISDLPANATKQICARFKTSKITTLNFNTTAASEKVSATQTACATEVIGVPAILLEKADDPDPVAIGDTTTYTVKVTNQGTAEDANVQIIVTIAPELVPVSSAEESTTVY
jgi:uncharacterized repeat protein (TIGR01451 family)